MIIEGYEFPEAVWYHPEEHLWLRPAEGEAGGGPAVTVGVDAIGVHALGEVVYVQLVEPGRAVRRGEPIGSLEAEKMVRPLVAPVSGVVLAANAEVQASPRLLNADPYGRGWLVRIGAERWEREAPALLHDPEAVRAWVRAEVQAHEERA